MQMDNTNTLVIFERINNYPQFAIGRLGDFKILFRISDGYINASKFVKMYRKDNKELRDWVKQKQANELVTYLQKEMKKPVIEKSEIGGNALKGSFVHPYIAVAGTLYGELCFLSVIFVTVKTSFFFF